MLITVLIQKITAMRLLPLFSILTVLVFTSCSSVRVASDYDKEANFTNYTSFAFFKPGIDKAEISDLDKKRILRAIEANLLAKGFVKSETPTMLISIFTKTRQNINIYQNNWAWGYGWGWNPWYWNAPMGPYNNTSTSTQGSLYIDLIDAEKKELVWQGIGTASLTQDVERKQERINEIVNAILEKYPPGAAQQKK